MVRFVSLCFALCALASPALAGGDVFAHVAIDENFEGTGAARCTTDLSDEIAVV